jgi:hypothetical protein
MSGPVSGSVPGKHVACRECETGAAKLHSSTVTFTNRVNWNVTSYHREPAILKLLTHVPKLILHVKTHPTADNRYAHRTVYAVKNYTPTQVTLKDTSQTAHKREGNLIIISPCRK